jgi:DNA polymerase III alpha subunit (gram-positive type)
MYLAFDVETTGLENHCNVLTAYFIILNSEFNKIDTLDLKIKYPYYVIYPKALEVNQINILEHDKDEQSVYKELAILKLNAFLEKNKTDIKYKIMGHNVQFDLKMLINNNIFYDELINKYLDLSENIDTLTYAKKLKNKKIIPKNQSLSLSKICYYYDLNYNNNVNFHNAEYDINLTVLLYKKLKQIESDFS